MIATKQNSARAEFLSFLFLLIGILFMGVVGLSVWFVPHIAHAQRYGNAIATTQHISGGTPRAGDVVSFDPHAGTFYLTYTVSDTNIAGIVAQNPILLLSDKNGGTPVVTSGQTTVNVTTKNGPISVGDFLTSSAIRGVAERAGNTASYIIGTALSAFPPVASTTVSSSVTGQVQVLLSIGSNPALSAGNNPSSVSPTSPAASAAATAAGAAIIFRMVKYLLAALVTAGTIYVAFRTSHAAMNSSIISIGRNPLAKRSIRSMLFADTAIIVLISVVGLAMALALVLVPV